MKCAHVVHCCTQRFCSIFFYFSGFKCPKKTILFLNYYKILGWPANFRVLNDLLPRCEIISLGNLYRTRCNNLCLVPYFSFLHFWSFFYIFYFYYITQFHNFKQLNLSSIQVHACFFSLFNIFQFIQKLGERATTMVVPPR